MIAISVVGLRCFLVGTQPRCLYTASVNCLRFVATDAWICGTVSRLHSFIHILCGITHVRLFFRLTSRPISFKISHCSYCIYICSCDPYLSDMSSNNNCGHCGTSHAGGKNSCTRNGVGRHANGGGNARFCAGCRNELARRTSLTAVPVSTPVVSAVRANGSGANQYGVPREITHAFTVASSAFEYVTFNRSLPAVAEEYGRFATITMDRVETRFFVIAAGTNNPAGTVWSRFMNSGVQAPTANRLITMNGVVGTNIPSSNPVGAGENFTETFGRASRDLSASLRSPPVPALTLAVQNDSNVSIRVLVTLHVRCLSPQDPNAVPAAGAYSPSFADASVHPGWIIVRDAVNPRFATIRLVQGRRFAYVADSGVNVLCYADGAAPTIAGALSFDGQRILDSAFPGLLAWVASIPTAGTRTSGTTGRVLIFIGE
uniref:Capsid protein n=1 Tax=Rhizoctonia solani beny-like virus 2 TaxID=2818417 RepID=A0AAU7PF53_9VIRU